MVTVGIGISRLAPKMIKRISSVPIIVPIFVIHQTLLDFRAYFIDLKAISLSKVIILMSDKVARTHQTQTNRARPRSTLDKKVVYKSVLNNPFRVEW